MIKANRKADGIADTGYDRQANGGDVEVNKVIVSSAKAAKRRLPTSARCKRLNPPPPQRERNVALIDNDEYGSFPEDEEPEASDEADESWGPNKRARLRLAREAKRRRMMKEKGKAPKVLTPHRKTPKLSESRKQRNRR